jgi:hypothetical protein
MTLENLIYAGIAAIVGVAATVITTLIKRGRGGGKVDEEKIKLNIEKIINELNIGDVHFYILNENKNFSTEKEMKFKFKSKGARVVSSNLNSIYQISGSSGRIGILVASEPVCNIRKHAERIALYF